MKTIYTLIFLLFTLTLSAQQSQPSERSLLIRAGKQGATGSTMMFIGSGLALGSTLAFDNYDDEQIRKVGIGFGSGMFLIGTLIQMSAWKKVTEAGRAIPKKDNLSLTLDEHGVGFIYIF